jgi:hypothetical protein
MHRAIRVPDGCFSLRRGSHIPVTRQALLVLPSENRPPMRVSFADEITLSPMADAE